jgi:hypothetical protein
MARKQGGRICGVGSAASLSVTISVTKVSLGKRGLDEPAVARVGRNIRSLEWRRRAAIAIPGCVFMGPGVERALLHHLDRRSEAARAFDLGSAGIVGRGNLFHR